MSSLEDFKMTLENVPSEFQRSFTMIKNLDRRTSETMTKVEENIKAYKKAKSKKVRKSIRSQTNELFVQLQGFADDKIRQSLVSYEMVDRNISRLIEMCQRSGSSSEDEEYDNKQAIKVNMPVDEHEPIFCTCGEPSHGEMIACERFDCPIEWFHMSCVGLEKPPPGKWFCGDCLPKAYKDRRQKRAKRRW